MARRGRRGSGGGRGLMSSRGILPVSGIIGGALLGFGAAAVAKRFMPGLLGGWTGTAAGFAVGGLPGAVAGYFHDGTGGTSSGTGGQVLS